MLVHIKELFNKEKVLGHFAYPAFNTINLETTLGIVAAAEELDAPLILQVTEGAIKYGGLETMYEIIATVASRARVPIALHMDHGKDAELLKRGIDLGFSSVMLDHSFEDIDENIKDTKEMVEFAHGRGAWVQGEIGKIRGNEDWLSVADNEALLTDPKDALQFVEATGVDTLACAVGTIHGIIKMSGRVHPKVDISRIEAIHKLINIPIVLHGASGVEKEVVGQAVAAGVGIINIDTELRIAFRDSLHHSIANQPDEVDPRKIMKPVIEAVKAAAESNLRDFGTVNINN